MNSINMIGRLTADPEVRDTETKAGEGLVLATFTVAVARVGSEDADFIRCKAFGKTAEFAEKYLKKGQRVGVTGRIQTGRYEDKDGVTHWTTDVIAERITFADGQKEEDEDRPARKAQAGSSRKQGARR